jgi:hypothetical protein
LRTCINDTFVNEYLSQPGKKEYPIGTIAHEEQNWPTREEVWTETFCATSPCPGFELLSSFLGQQHGTKDYILRRMDWKVRSDFGNYIKKHQNIINNIKYERSLIYSPACKVNAWINYYPQIQSGYLTNQRSFVQVTNQPQNEVYCMTTATPNNPSRKVVLSFGRQGMGHDVYQYDFTPGFTQSLLANSIVKFDPSVGGLFAQNSKVHPDFCVKHELALMYGLESKLRSCLNAPDLKQFQIVLNNNPKKIQFQSIQTQLPCPAGTY